MAPIYQTLAFLSIALSAFAVDVELFKEDSRCEEDQFDFCVNIPAFSCCGTNERLYFSCQAIGAGVQAFSGTPLSDPPVICANLLGGSYECWGVSDDIERINGCWWTEGLLKRTHPAKFANALRGEDGVEECLTPTHTGKYIGGKKYGIDMSRPEFAQLGNLTSVEEKDKFFIENADIVREK